MTSASVHRTVSVGAGVGIRGGGVAGGGGARNADLFIYLHFSPRYLSRRFFNDNNKRRQKKRPHLLFISQSSSMGSQLCLVFASRAAVVRLFHQVAWFKVRFTFGSGNGGSKPELLLRFLIGKARLSTACHRVRSGVCLTHPSPTGWN